MDIPNSDLNQYLKFLAAHAFKNTADFNLKLIHEQTVRIQFVKYVDDDDDSIRDVPPEFQIGLLQAGCHTFARNVTKNFHFGSSKSPKKPYHLLKLYFQTMKV